MGWVAQRRDLGNLLFLDVRDRTGIVQVVFNKETQPEAHAKAEHVRSEYVVAVEGKVIKRQKANPELATGEVELVATKLHVLNNAKTPPFQIEDEINAAEETRLRYRYLDLRRPRPHRNLALRHNIILEIRKTMDEMGFIEVETPMLTRSTPEGARDFLVPSRVHHGQFYALPQSPQIFKQILMIGGLDRYFQIVKCFRDEDQRADRQLEFTQLDLEMSFPRQEDIFHVIEQVMVRACAVAGVKAERPVPAHALQRRHPQIRQRQARHALRHGAARSHRLLPARSQRKTADRRQRLRLRRARRRKLFAQATRRADRKSEIRRRSRRVLRQSRRRRHDFDGRKIDRRRKRREASESLRRKNRRSWSLPSPPKRKSKAPKPPRWSQANCACNSAKRSA